MVGIYAYELEVNGGKTVINSELNGIDLFGGKAKFNDGEVYITALTGMAIYNYSDTQQTENLISISDNLRILEEGLDIKEYYFDGNYYYTIGKDIDLTGITEYSDFEALIPKKVSIACKKAVTFDANGGEGKMDTILMYNGKLDLPENKFTAPHGQQFKGWSLTKDGEIITSLDVTENTTIYAIWEYIPAEYTIISGDNQTFEIGNAQEYIIKIDGNFSLFDSLTIEGLELIKDEDYTVTEGSTIITFLKSGIAKINTLPVGNYNLVANYKNGKTVTSKLTIKEKPQEPQEPQETPKTGDTVIISMGVLIISVLGLITIKKIKE